MDKWEEVIRRFCHNDRGSMLFTSKATEPHCFSEGRKLNNVFFNFTEHINHLFENTDKQLNINAPLGKVLDCVEEELKKIRNENNNFYYRTWVVANTAQDNPYIKYKNISQTFCLWVFFAIRPTDYIWTSGFGESTSEYHIYGCANLYLTDLKQNLPIWPLYTRLILDNQHNSFFVDEIYKQILNPIFDFDSYEFTINED